jgi:hypothetical protein
MGLLKKGPVRQAERRQEGPMPWTQRVRTLAFASIAVSALAFCCARGQAEVAVLMEEPYGFFGILAPAGHSAIYLDRVCAETPLKLRRCRPDELGSVITREPDMAGYDWVAIPLLPYLYSVENASEVPRHANGNLVWRMRRRYHETHLRSLGEKVSEGSFFKGGWGMLLGQSYDRRMFAFRFETTPEQDDQLIARLNAGRNHSHFHYLFNNCSDFTRKILNAYFPNTFRRSIFPDFWMTTPRQVTDKLAHFSRKHPEIKLAVFEIPQIPGFRRPSGANLTVIGSFTTRGIPVPVAFLNPYAAGALLLDFLLENHSPVVPKDAPVLGPDNLAVLKVPSPPEQNPVERELQTAATATIWAATLDEVSTVNLSLGEINIPRE